MKAPFARFSARLGALLALATAAPAATPAEPPPNIVLMFVDNLGNGDVGINAWVESSGDLVFYVSKTDAWDENGRLCKIGRVRVKFDPPLPVTAAFRQELRPPRGLLPENERQAHRPSRRHERGSPR